MTSTNKTHIRAELLVGFIYRFYPPLAWFPEYRLALEIAERFNCRRVLDVGCAAGNLFVVLSTRGLVDEYVGLDKRNIFRVRDPRARFIRCNARTPPPEVAGGGFDCVFFVNSLFYIGADALKQYSMLGDVVAVIDIDPSKPHIRFVSWLEGVRRMTLRELASYAEQLGLKVLMQVPGAQYALVVSR
ncbi:MAG: class I SAM-dependent methyltransferase [Thermofilaceae archaeon]